MGGDPSLVLTFQDVQTDAPKLVNVRVEDLGQKPYLWRSHRVVIG